MILLYFVYKKKIFIILANNIIPWKISLLEYTNNTNYKISWSWYLAFIKAILYIYYYLISDNKYHFYESNWILLWYYSTIIPYINGHST